jgi:glycine/serine hydroxymethyltransferase
MKEPEMEQVALLINEVLTQGEGIRPTVMEKVTELCARFPLYAELQT